MRTFQEISTYSDGSLALALAPALTPHGYETHPVFFDGYLRRPQILSRGLLVLADITATRYFKYTPSNLRDPVISAQGDRLRAECFSACNGVYARLDLLEELLDGDVTYGTTNVDIGAHFRDVLTKVRHQDKFKLRVGEDGLNAFHSGSDGLIHMAVQRPVEMPDRWIRALGNAAMIHRSMKPIFSAKGVAAQSFIASIPSATSKEQSGWLTYQKNGVKLMMKGSTESVYISGLNRLSGLKRVMSDVKELRFYAPDESGAMMIEADLNGARLTLSLTQKSWQGYSGEGSLLEALSNYEVIEHSDMILSSLGFESKLEETSIMKTWNLSKEELDLSLALLCVNGKLGYDAHEMHYYHRELPEEDRVLKDNPRLVGAKKLVGNVKAHSNHTWLVNSGGTDYKVCYDEAKDIHEATCTCTWYLNHQNKRGPCKHILAVKLHQSNVIE